MRNERQKSGRIVVPNTDNLGRFVPPKDPNFLSNIEDGVVRLVMACLSKGLRTVSSCEGHPEDRDNREITLAFKLKSELDRFKEIVPEYRLTETEQFFSSKTDQSESTKNAFGSEYNHFLTVWIDPPDVEEKTTELEQRIVELYSPSYNI